MKTSRRSLLKIIAAGAVPKLAINGANHTYEAGADRFLLDGKPFVVRSGEMHYARVPREYWRDRMKKMRGAEHALHVLILEYA